MCVTFNHKQDLKTRKTRKCHHFQILNTNGKSNHDDDENDKTEEEDGNTRCTSESNMGDLEEDSTWRFRYLVSIFESGGGQIVDVERRVTMTTQRFGQMPLPGRLLCVCMYLSTHSTVLHSYLMCIYSIIYECSSIRARML